MAIGANFVRNLTGGKAKVLEIHFSHRAPNDPTVYERFLKTIARFDQHQTCLMFPRAAMRTPIVGADPARYAELTARLDAALKLDEASAAELLRHHLRPLLLRGETSLDAAAAKLGMSGRTLDRRLMDEETSFAKERDGARFRLCQELLTLTDLPVGEMAAALSYSSHGNFARAFRRWSGVTPSQWRAGVTEQKAPGTHDPFSGGSSA